MPLVSMKDMLNKALDEKYAVGQFNINNLEWTQAILAAAEQEKSPVILGVSEGAARHMGGFKTTVMMVQGLLEDMKITVPVAIHLDHGSSFDKCKEAIEAGFTSVMIDASHHPIEENIETTKKVVEFAHRLENPRHVPLLPSSVAHEESADGGRGLRRDRRRRTGHALRPDRSPIRCRVHATTRSHRAPTSIRC